MICGQAFCIEFVKENTILKKPKRTRQRKRNHSLLHILPLSTMRKELPKRHFSTVKIPQRSKEIIVIKVGQQGVASMTEDPKDTDPGHVLDPDPEVAQDAKAV